MAQIRPALHQARATLRRTRRIHPRRRQMPARAKPVRAPFPGVPHNSEQSVSIGRKCIGRTHRSEAIFARVVMRKLALPHIAHVLAVRSEFVAPGINLLLQTAARGILPLSFRRKTLARPPSVGSSIVPAQLHNGITESSINRTRRTLRPFPARARDFGPPFSPRNAILDEFPRHMRVK